MRSITLLLFAVLTLFLAPSSKAETVNVTYRFTDFTTAPAAVKRLTLTPLAKFADYNGATLSDQPMVRITDTNGVYIFTNLVAGYSYRYQLDTPFNSVIGTNGFPTGLSGDVNATDYRGVFVGQTFAYFNPTNLSNFLEATNPVALGTLTATNNGEYLSWEDGVLISSTRVESPDVRVLGASGGGNVLAYVDNLGDIHKTETSSTQVDDNTSAIAVNAAAISANTTAINGKVAKASNGSDFSNMDTARNNLAAMDINVNSGISGGPEYAWTNATPTRSSQIGIVRNSGTSALYHSVGTGLGQWWGNWLFNGSVAIGSQYWMSNATSADVGLRVWGNGSTNFISDTGAATGSELTMVVEQADPRQATYINFAAPSTVSMPARTVTMSNPVDFQIGISGILYGTNTLGGLPMRNDALFTLNQGTDMFWTTTENKGSFGCRSFLEYDNTNGVWAWPVDRADNGIMGTAGHQIVLKIDTKTKVIQSTNADVIFGDSGTNSIILNGTNITIGGSGGTANIANGSFARLAVKGGSSVCTPAISINASGFGMAGYGTGNNKTTDFGYCSGQTTTNITVVINDITGGSVRLNSAVTIGTNDTPNASAVLDLKSTTKGLLLPRMTKTQRDAISTPVAGLAIYQTDNTPGLRVYNGTSWMKYTETAD